MVKISCRTFVCLLNFVGLFLFKQLLSLTVIPLFCNLPSRLLIFFVFLLIEIASSYISSAILTSLKAFGGTIRGLFLKLWFKSCES